jgi:hypothetical protein
MSTFECYSCDNNIPCVLTIKEPVPRVPWGCPWYPRLKTPNNNNAQWIKKEVDL